MPLKLDTLEEAQLNLTPMVDIVLLLVIFFMVGTQFTEAERQYQIDLPTVTEAQPLTALPDEIVINIREDGVLTVGQNEMTPEQLVDRLREAQQRYPDQAVVIRGDADVPYQVIMSVLNICQRVNLHNIQLANRLEVDGG